MFQASKKLITYMSLTVTLLGIHALYTGGFMMSRTISHTYRRALKVRCMQDAKSSIMRACIYGTHYETKKDAEKEKGPEREFNLRSPMYYCGETLDDRADALLRKLEIWK